MPHSEAVCARDGPQAMQKWTISCQRLPNTCALFGVRIGRLEAFALEKKTLWIMLATLAILKTGASIRTS